MVMVALVRAALGVAGASAEAVLYGAPMPGRSAVAALARAGMLAAAKAAGAAIAFVAAGGLAIAVPLSLVVAMVGRAIAAVTAAASAIEGVRRSAAGGGPARVAIALVFARAGALGGAAIVGVIGAARVADVRPVVARLLGLPARPAGRFPVAGAVRRFAERAGFAAPAPSDVILIL